MGVAWGYAVTGCLRSLNAWWQFSSALNELERRRDSTRTAEAVVGAIDDTLRPEGER